MALSQDELNLVKAELSVDPAKVGYEAYVGTLSDDGSRSAAAWDLLCVGPHDPAIHGADSSGCAWCAAKAPTSGTPRRIAILGAPLGSRADAALALEQLGWATS